MATDNPKVSGYVPQAVYDHLLTFKSERGLKSISMALTGVLEEYFGLSKATISDATASRLSTLEGKVASLTETVAALSQAIADMKSISGLPVVDSELQNKQEPPTNIVPVDSTSIPPVDQSELDTTTAGSLLVDKGELLTEPTPTEPITASSPLVEISEPQEQTVEHDANEVQVDQKSESSPQVDDSIPVETTVVSSSQVDESIPVETTAVSSSTVDNSESLAEMRGSATVGVATTEVIEFDNSLPEPTSNSSPAIEPSELLTEVKPDINPPVVQSEPISESTPTEPIEASKTPATKRTSKPRSQSLSEPQRRKTRRRVK